LRETNIRSELNIVIVSIRRQDGQTLFNPHGETAIASGDLLIAIGRAETIMQLNTLAHGHASSHHKSKNHKTT
jgi:Trk K+ transport system NAD-binding subunit